MIGCPECSSTRHKQVPLEAFSGTIPRTKTSPLYSAGLAIVAFAMVLLPLLYIALIGFTAGIVFVHLKHDTWLLQGGSGRNGFLRLVLYLGPAVAGGILAFFMVKPFFAKKAKPPQPISLHPDQERLLFAFVQKICGLVRAPAPCRIDVDCQVNASASLRSGFWSKDLVLTIGLPLVAGLQMRQFAGVLAHEFGHFAQGAGMRLTYIIRNINFWFARVVYDRDEWDLKLEQSARSIDWRFGIVLHTARGCVWVTRRILWALMQLGNAISCFMLRQMEFDADSYEAKLAGSDAFERTASQLRLLNVATHTAYQQVEQSWASKRLPENLPLLIGHKASTLPPDVHQKLSDSAASEKTGWFDTHPCDADRIREAHRLNEPGVFRIEDPATELFSDFNALSKQVTRHQYQAHLELEFSEENLMPAEEVLRESAAAAEAEELVARFFGAVNISLKPLVDAPAIPVSVADHSDLQKWREAREATRSLRAQAESTSSEWSKLYSAFIQVTGAWYLARAGFRLEPKDFGLPTSATSVGEQEIAAKFGVEEKSAALVEQAQKLEPFMAALRQRVNSALVLGSAAVADPSTTSEMEQLLALLAAIGPEISRAYQIGGKLKAFALLAQNRPNHSNPAEVDTIVAQLAAEMESFVRGVQDRFKGFVYPFPHARGQLTVADYAKYEKEADNSWVQAYLDANAHVERLFALNYRLIGRVLGFVGRAETAIESRG